MSRRFCPARPCLQLPGRTKAFRQRFRATRFLLRVVWTLVLGGPATAHATEELFKRTELALEKGGHTTLIAGLSGSGSTQDLAVIEADRDGRIVRSFRLDGDRWTPSAEREIPTATLLVDVLERRGRSELLAFRLNENATGELVVLGHAGAQQTVVDNVSTSFTFTHPHQTPHVDLTHDLNGDGRDDLAVPTESGFWIATQREDGTFHEALVLGPPADLRPILGADGYRYDPWSVSRIFSVDATNDGRRDLVAWDGGNLAVHSQRSNGTFAPEPVALEVPFPIDAASTSELSRELQGTALHAVANVNGDGAADLVLLELEKRRWGRHRSAVHVHYGRYEGGRLAFSQTPDSALESNGIQVKLELLDLDGNGTLEILTQSVPLANLRSNWLQNFEGFMGGYIPLHIELFRLQGQREIDEPNAHHRNLLHFPAAHQEFGWIPLDIALRGGLHEKRRSQDQHLRAFNAPLLLGDVNGDGRTDLLAEWRKPLRELNEKSDQINLGVRFGVAGSQLLAPEPQKILLDTPHETELLWLQDLNGDQKMDIVVHHGGECPDRITVLFAR